MQRNQKEQRLKSIKQQGTGGELCMSFHVTRAWSVRHRDKTRGSGSPHGGLLALS